ncbi:hypothetical protein FOMPIDRAFT_1021361 [Fomitopsis schrenkii]|uniref:Uncharacterized protein n=1 Tax=Fomitopsis schrenkii TaxID=2126942 RepID=S8EMZ6_FOMSC|nr:hypothetical protein FOMPIDRAFT_1021361 [Fomitopsis schrenkii]
MSQDMGQTDPQFAPSQDATLGPFQGLSSLAEPEGSHDTQYFDDWLALLESIPPGDPNDPAALPDLRNVLDDFASGNGSESTPGMLDMQGQTFDFPNFFDPALLDIPVFPDNSPTFTPDPTVQASAPTCSSHAQTSASLSIPTSVSASSASHREGPAQAAFFAQNHVPTPSRNTTYLSTSVPRQSASATPSLTGSPLASTVSLADTEPSPATPEWGWAFGEPGVVTGSVLDGLNATGANVDGIVVGEAEMKEFEKVLEETCGPLSALSTLQFDQETECGADRMDVDSVGPDGSAPAVAQPLFEGAEVPDVAMTGVPSTAEPQQGVGAQLVLPDPALLQVQLNGQPPLCGQLNAQDTAPALEQPQWLSAGVPVVSSSNASVQSLPPAVTRAHTEPPATTALPPSLASSDAPGLPASRSSPAPSAASQLSALSSLLALTNASKPASTSRLTRAEVLQRAKAMRRDLERARERARVELWETTVEGACLVGLGRELTKGPGAGGG